MKKIFILAAIVAIAASCTKTGSTSYDTPEEISFSPYNYKATKLYGPVENTTYPETEKFVVYAQHTTTDAGATLTSDSGTLNPYLSGVTFAKRSDQTNGQNVWGGYNTDENKDVSYYWPRTGSLYFAGYSPQGCTSTASYSFDKSGTVGLTIENFSQGDYAYTAGLNNPPVETPDPTAYKMVDLMWFDASNTSASEEVQNVTFKHALSWITINIKVANDNLNDLFKIKSVKLSRIYTQGKFESKYWASDNTTASPTWTSKGTVTNDYSLYLNDNGTGLSATAFVIDDLLLIPQACADLVIEYTQSAASGTPAITQTATLDLQGGTDASTRGNNWILGYHYTYNVTFTAEEILINPTVESWKTLSQDFDNQ